MAYSGVQESSEVKTATIVTAMAVAFFTVGALMLAVLLMLETSAVLLEMFARMMEELT